MHVSATRRNCKRNDHRVGLIIQTTVISYASAIATVIIIMIMIIIIIITFKGAQPTSDTIVVLHDLPCC